MADREQLQFLTEQPIGSPALQDEADRIKHRGIKPSPELKETCERASKKWLPEGRTPARRGACNEPSAEQTDIEDAVESAGGRRGSLAA